MTLSLAGCWLERGRSPERGRGGEAGKGEGEGKEEGEGDSQSPPPRAVWKWGICTRGEWLNSRDTWGHAGEPGCTPGLELRGRDLLDFPGGRHVRQPPAPRGCPAGSGGRVGTGRSSQLGGGRRARGGGTHLPHSAITSPRTSSVASKTSAASSQSGRGESSPRSHSAEEGGQGTAAGPGVAVAPSTERCPRGPRRGSGHSGASRRGQWRLPKDGGPHGTPNTWSPWGGS